MPKFRVTSPDGRTFDVNAPDGATQEQAIEYVKAQHAAPAAETETEKAPAEASGGFWDDLASAYKGEPHAENHYGTLLPLAREPSGDARFGAPEVLQDALRAFSAPRRVLTGDVAPQNIQGEAMNLAGMITGGAPALSSIKELAPPAGALAMNALTSKPVVATAKGISKGVTSIAQPALDRIFPDSAIGRTLAKRVMQEHPGMTLDEAIAAKEARMKELGPQAVVADTGDSLQQLARTMIQNPGETSPLAKEILGNREASEGTRFVESAQRNVSSKGFYDVEAGVQASKKKSGPFYQKAYDENPNVSTLGLQMLLDKEPLVKQGINAGVELQRIEHNKDMLKSADPKEFDYSRYGVTDFNEAGEPVLGQVTPLRLWHAAREGLDSMYRAEVDKITGEVTKKGGQIAGLRKGLNEEIRRLTGGDTGNFAKADKIYADASQLKRALDEGRGFVTGDQEITDKYFNSLSNREKDAYRSGVAQEMIKKARDVGATPRQFIIALKDASGVRAKLKTILPTTKQFDAFVKDIAREVTFRDTNKLRFGSQTFRLGQEEGQANADVLTGMAQAGAQALQGNHIGAVTSLLGKASNAMKRAQMPQATRNKLGKLLLSQDRADHAEAFKLMREAQSSGWVYAP